MNKVLEAVINTETVTATTEVEAYRQAMMLWSKECETWAERWTQKLWKPWTMYKVRYAALDVGRAVGEGDDLDWLQQVYVLDAPEDIVTQRPVARVEAVDVWGNVTPGFAIARFVDALPVFYEKPSIERAMDHHRTYYAGTYKVNVPAWELRAPTDEPPTEPVRPESDYPNPF